MKNIHKKDFFVVLLLASLPFCFIGILKLWQSTTEDEQRISREKLTKVTAKLKGGMSKAEVYEVFDDNNWTSFSEHGDEVWLSTKPQPLPTNWIVRLHFKDGKLAAIKYGTADNISKRPENAPPEQLFE